MNDHLHSGKTHRNACAWILVSVREGEAILDSSEDSPSSRGHTLVTPLQKGTMKRGQDLSERVDLSRSPFAQKEGLKEPPCMWGGWRRAPFSLIHCE